MEQKIITVSKLNQYIKNLVEGDANLAAVLVQGEVSNLTKHYTGHYYFSIKDDNSKLSCMMFSYNAKNLRFDMKNGDLVVIFGYISLYEKTGSYQLYARSIEPFGIGQELLRIEALKKKLKEEGVFDIPKKKIPQYPKRIGLVTSSVGAAVHDFIHTIQSRWNVEIYVFSCLVQGKEAPKSIIKALELTKSYSLDTIIIGRGGGANEDLSAYNDEGVVRAVIACEVPVISAIGHQIDSSIVDLVSDYACITPTEAGALATPDREAIKENLISIKEYISSIMERKIDKLKQRLLEITSSKAFISRIDKLKLEMKEKDKANEKAKYLINNKIVALRNCINSLNGKLASLNPYSILTKGYSLVYSEEGNVLTSIDEIKLDNKLIINMKDGQVEAKVIKVNKGERYGKGNDN